MLDDGRDDPEALAALHAELETARAGMRARLAQLLDVERDYAAAGQKVREWMFVEKLAQELAQAQPAR